MHTTIFPGTAVPYNQNSADGSEENPYRYLCTESAYVTGDFLSQLAEEKTYAVFEIRENNEVSGEACDRMGSGRCTDRCA